MAIVTVVGSTSWGTTLAMCLASSHQVRLLTRSEREAEVLRTTRRNPRLVVNATLPATVEVTAEPDRALSGSNVALLVVPSQSMRDNVRALRPALERVPVVVSAAKGLEASTELRMSEVIDQELGGTSSSRIAVLSGPNLAPEIALGKPATSLVASSSLETAQSVASLFMTPRLRVYSQTDVLGVELCGALKNIIAIGAGVSDGKGYGDNAKAAFVTRGLAEMTRLGTAAGANPLTFAGLAGIGDLWATCASNYSRNRWVGTELARGRPVAEILDDMHHVAEGVPTTQAAKSMGERLGVETPIIDQAFRVLFEGLDVETALVELMVRDAKHELEGLLLV